MNPLILLLCYCGVSVVALYILACCAMFLYILIGGIEDDMKFREFWNLVGSAFVLSLAGLFWIWILLDSHRTEKEMAARLKQYN